MKLVIIGTGRLGQALSIGLVRYRPVQLSGRDVVAKLAAQPLEVTLGPDTTAVIHAAGPAGEAACLEDPVAAFTMHYRLTERLAQWAADTHRHLFLLGTVAPDVGFYGPLKRAAVYRAEMTTAQVTTVECGHVIGEGLPVSDRNAGVIARFVHAAVQGRDMHLAGGGQQTLRYTALPHLITCLQMLLERLGAHPLPLRVAPVSGPVSIADIARTCLRLADVLFGVKTSKMLHSHRTVQPNYEDPTGEVYPAPHLVDVLVQWMRTVEVKILLGTR